MSKRFSPLALNGLCAPTKARLVCFCGAVKNALVLWPNLFGWLVSAPELALDGVPQDVSDEEVS